MNLLTTIEQQMTKKRKKETSGCARAKISTVMREYSRGGLHSGSKKGRIVKSKKQALAIAYSEARKKC